ncbi:hypothetical protein HanIR_Chr04g0167041 [Helianthus annuus]|nr:hypothetical protein HanIR_Chr04g0167041 [Helianthus annuus]KAJ0756883.1 hypothetical protein HanLR1_Chr04g0132201 [Helianthus annuus]
MDESTTSKHERNASRKEKQAFRQALHSEYARYLMNDLEGSPEEVREVIGTEDRDVTKYRAKMEERARREEALFTRAPLTRMDKKRLKHVCESSNGLHGLAYGFEDDIKSLPLEDGVDGQMSSFMYLDGRERKLKRRKVNKRVTSPSYHRSQEAPFRVHFA